MPPILSTLQECVHAFPRRGTDTPLPRRLVANHPHPTAAFCDAIRIRVREAAEPDDPYGARCIIVPDHGRRAPSAGRHGRGARAERVDRPCAPAPWVGAHRDAAEHPR